MQNLFVRKNFVAVCLLVFTSIVIAKTWGPVLVWLYGGANKDNSLEADAQLYWVAAQTAAKVTLGPAFVSALGGVKKNDLIEFQYRDGKTIKLKYKGGYPGTLILEDPTEQYSGPGCTGCSNNGSTTRTNVYYTGYWNTVGSDGPNGQAIVTANWVSVTLFLSQPTPTASAMLKHYC
jgi:hypothetical protein